MADLKRRRGRSHRARQALRRPAATATCRRSAAIRPTLLDDQVKLNDPGASQYLIETLAQDGWNGLLRFYEGEVWRLRNRPGDDVRAAQSYAAAVAYPDAPADAWRWHGISLMKQGRPAEAKAAFARYLTMKPDAPDAAWVRQMVGLRRRSSMKRHVQASLLAASALALSRLLQRSAPANMASATMRWSAVQRVKVGDGR